MQATVAIKSRLDGQIVKVGFSDGQDVAKGQTLFEIDARPLEAQLLQAQAALARDKSQLDRARAQEYALLATLLSLPQPEGIAPLTLSPQKQKQKTQEALVAWTVEEAEKAAVYCAAAGIGGNCLE